MGVISLAALVFALVFSMGFASTLSPEETQLLRKSLFLESCQQTPVAKMAAKLSLEARTWVEGLKSPPPSPAFRSLKEFKAQISYFEVLKALDQEGRKLVASSQQKSKKGTHSKGARPSASSMDQMLEPLANCHEEVETLLVSMAAIHQQKRNGAPNLDLNEETLSGFLPSDWPQAPSAQLKFPLRERETGVLQPPRAKPAVR